MILSHEQKEIFIGQKPSNTVNLAYEMNCLFIFLYSLWLIEKPLLGGKSKGVKVL